MDLYDTATAGEQAPNLQLGWSDSFFLQVGGEQPAPSSVSFAASCKDTDLVSTGSHEILSLGSGT